ncbi:hypothetical protein G5714_009998 [Onychostoma macrolepis]|uniref:Uncharacterized protein n=1 Tax=Onychostoma macrolepis TaxID=369639 RepID=A0A7J6CQQ7_9TELE|nr:hypothetical protein G5714_009998 [Onychostoma macrolepis]
MRVSDGGEGSERRKIALILRQGGVSTHSGVSTLFQWLVFGAGCSFPSPRDNVRNAALFLVLAACRLCQGGASGSSSPDGASAMAV